MEERRRKRKVITRSDQELLNHVRAVFKANASEAQLLDRKKLGTLLGVKNPMLAQRVYDMFAANAQGAATGPTEGGDGGVEGRSGVEAVTREPGGNGEAGSEPPGGDGTAGRGGIDEAVFQRSVISLVLGEEEPKLRFVFDLHDVDGDGEISRDDLSRMLDASRDNNAISMSDRQGRDMAELLFQEADRKRDGRVDFGELKMLLARFPLVRNDLIKSMAAWFWKEGDGHAWHRRSRASRLRFLLLVLPSLVYQNLLLVAWLALNAFLFWNAAHRYALEGANTCIQVARGAGVCLNLNGALVLIPMMRTLLAWIRKSALAALVPVDSSIDIHKLIGHALFVFSIVHSAAHLMNYASLAPTVPFDRNLFGTEAGLTGVILLAVFGIMWLFAQDFIRRRRWFEVFYVTHGLYLAFFVLLLAHGWNFWKWALVPLIAYGVELYLKTYRRRHVSFVRRAAALPSEVSGLHIRRPEGFAFQPGDYLFLKVPKVSRFEWHPFTISSSPEEQKDLSVHVRGLGNWTRALYEVVQHLPEDDPYLPVEIRGPFGAPSSRIFRSQTAILIGAGIGVTPFASILRSILYRHQQGEDLKLQKVYFFWLNRDRRSFEWFTDMLAEIEKAGMENFIELNIYLTDTTVNATSGLIKIGMDLLGRQEGHDLTTGLQTITTFGRPNWERVFHDIARRGRHQAVDVYFCGPYPLSQVVKHAARRQGFRFRKENF
jgi:predicted ferric reductase